MKSKNNLNNIWSGLVIEELIRNKIDCFCVSPGSRSTPLIAEAAYNKKAKKVVFYDERGSSYFALGFAQANLKPAVIIVTSGTAVANLFPAIIEAFQSKIPMIVLTADRPPELQETGANQTINQDNIFGKYVKWFFNMPCPDYNIKPSFVLSNIDYAVNQSLTEPMGPVHLNFMFREPLEPSINKKDNKIKNYLQEINSWTKKPVPYCNFIKAIKKSEASPADFIMETISKNNKGLISVGRLYDDSARKAILKLLKVLKWPVYADISSGLRLRKEIGTNIIKHLDTGLLSPDFCKTIKPETVIHFGERITSKRFFEFFSSNKPEAFINIKNENTRYNPGHLAFRVIETEIPDFCNGLTKKIKKIKQKQDFKNLYLKKAADSQKIISRNLKKDNRLSEVFISRFLSQNIPEDFCLFLSNSMPVRDMELYADAADLNIKIGTNRGASGIDGIIASAAGFAAGNCKPCVALIGDIAFIHDISSLSFIRNNANALVIILVNNDGGGIFNFLPISLFSEIFKKYFVIPHGLNFKGVAESFKIRYSLASNRSDFKKMFETAKLLAENENKSSIIEALTDGEHDFKLRRKIKYEIIEMLER